MSEPVSAAGWWRGVLGDAVLLLFVAGLGLKAAYGAPERRDLDPVDEALFYMMPAAAPGGPQLPSVEFSPLYVAWYALLMRTGLPPEQVLGLNWTLLAVLVPVSAFLLARALGASRAAALAAGGGLLATKLIDVWPYPAHFATVILALGGTATALAARRGYGAWAVASAGLTLLTATYARPEFLYSLGLLAPPAALGAVWSLCRRPGARGQVLAAAVVFAVGAALLVWAFGTPVSEGKRLPQALGEHYAINRQLSGDFPDGPSKWSLLWRNDFGDAESLGGMWRSNPEALLWHVGANVRRFPVALAEATDVWVDVLPLRFVHAYPGIPVRDRPRHFIAVAVVRAVMFGIATLGLFGAARAGRSGHRGALVGAGLLALVAAPAVAASLVVYPRYHYLIPTVVFAAALTAAGARHAPLPERWCGLARRAWWGPALAVALAVVVPNRADGWCIQMLLPGPSGPTVITEPPTPYRATVQTLRAVNAHERGPVLVSLRAVPFYAGFECRTPDLTPGAGFMECVRKTGARVVVLDPYLPVVSGWGNDPDLRALTEGKESATFRLVPIRGAPGFSIAIRRDPPVE